MKRFSRTTGGKALFFILCIIMMCVLAVSIIGAVLMLEADFYEKSEDEIVDMVYNEILSSRGDDIIWNSIAYTDDNQDSELSTEIPDDQSVTTAYDENYNFMSDGSNTMSEAEAAQEPQAEDNTFVSYYEITVSDEPDGYSLAEDETSYYEDEPEDDLIYVSVLYGQERPDDGNIIYEIRDRTGRVIAASESAGTIKSWKYSYTFAIVKDENGFINNVYEISNAYLNVYLNDQDFYTLNISLKEGLPETDIMRLAAGAVHAAYGMKYMIFIIGAVAMFAFIACFITLMCASARRPDSEELYPGPLNKVPTDLLTAVVVFVTLVILIIINNNFTYTYRASSAVNIAVCMFMFILSANILLSLAMSFAARIKQRRLLKNTVIFYILKGLWWLLKALGRGIRAIPIIWRTAAIAAGVTVIELIFWIVFFHDYDMLIIAWIVEKFILVPAVLYAAYMLRRLEKGGQALAAGDLTYHTETKGLVWNFRKHAENLNSIAGGMTIAVDERTKSERMKTELITNVSHDLKTPLTSIINYAGLVAHEPTDNPRITEYCEVLTRQSERLKRLIEDLVEASKASTGNLDVALAKCDANVFISQTSGEYEEKLEASGLQIVVRQPGFEVPIMADGRRMWRIFDNLMNNICKYSLAGSRVYLSLEEAAGYAVITFKNTSREPLDMSEEDLMERFTRGDSSRNTEGNGLGLSIARSMAELQGGTLDISIDGDLFKAVLRFPLCRS